MQFFLSNDYILNSSSHSTYNKKYVLSNLFKEYIVLSSKNVTVGIPGWLSSLGPAFRPGHDPGDLGSSPCRKPASPSACVSASLSLSLSLCL